MLSFRQVIRLYPEVAWVNSFRIADPGLAIERRPTLLAPMAAILGGERSGRMSISQQTMRHLLDSIATRLDEARDISRYMTGLLVFLGLLGTFWGLIETVGSVGKVIGGLEGQRRCRLAVRHAEGGTGRAARRHGHFVLVVAVRPRRLADPGLSRPAIEPGAKPLLHRSRRLARLHRARIWRRRGRRLGGELQHAMDRMRTVLEESGGGRSTTAAMANLAEAIQGLVAHMRTEQQMIREWADGQGEQNREIKKLLERMPGSPRRAENRKTFVWSARE